ncbi:hypothetical protein AB0L75_28145 [Streptomyces sp. NPDC052101]|uniref:hypothetical protein n=1 Tax=Streptomyces sp. NPDC052101 TaxID=3155763 RepID=UPI0034185530
MALHARKFFVELKLPFTDSAVIGDVYYAIPMPGGPLRLRIDFSPTIYAGGYDGLRIAAIHQDRGELDATILWFTEYKTFDHRDSTQGRNPHNSGYGTFREFRDRPDWVPWNGAHTNALRDAIEQYTCVWFPGAWKASSPRRAVGRTTQNAPARPSTRGPSRTH